MKKGIIFILLSILIIFGSACSEKKKKNMVDFNQIDTDGSHNLNYQFREEIETEKTNKKRYKKGPFE
jgi:hypothetical protein